MESIVDAMADSPSPAVAFEWTVLCVDDEPNIVSALRRLFRGSGYRVLVAHGGEEALTLMGEQRVDLVISDMRMPGMDGAQLLERIRLRWPSVTRVLLTGYADMQSTVAAINRGEIYRYLSKPWNDAEILMTVREAFERQGLLREKQRLEALTEAQNESLRSLNASLEGKVAERTLDLSQANDKLKKNYLTSIKAFSHLIGLRDRQLGEHARTVADLARRTARAVGVCDSGQQDIFVAGLLHDVGHIGLADNLLSRPVPRLAEDELKIYRKHPVLGEQALIALDGMQPIAALIRAHHERHDGTGFPDRLAAEDIPLGARILAIADTFADLQAGHLGARLDVAQARSLIARGRGTAFHPELVDVFLQVALQATPVECEVPIGVGCGDLRAGMVLARELVSGEGVMLLAVGQTLTADLIDRIRKYELRDRLQLVIFVRPPRPR